MFFLFTILSIPTFALFYHGSATYVEGVDENGVESHSHEAVDTENIDPFSSAYLHMILAKFTLGNLGEAHGYCGVSNFTDLDPDQDPDPTAGTLINPQSFNMTCHRNTRLGMIRGFWQIPDSNINCSGNCSSCLTPDMVDGKDK